MGVSTWLQGWVKRPSHALWRWLLESHPALPGLVAAGMAVGIWSLGGWQPLERLGYNMLFVARESLPHRRWDSRVVVVLVDEATLQRYRQFPLARDRYAQLLTVLEAGQPAAVGFDILFVEPTNQDAALAQAIAYNGRVVLAVAADRQRRTLKLVSSLAAVSKPGHIHSSPDPDGIWRRVDLYIQQFPAMSVALLQVYNRSLQQTVKAQASAPQPLAVIPSPQSVAKQTAWINWPGLTQGDTGLTTYSLADVLDDKIAPQAFRDKIVLVGVGVTGEDPLLTPLEHDLPTAGVYLHAAVIDNMLNQQFLQRLPEPLVGLFLFGVGVLSSVLLTPLGFKRRLLVLLVLPFGWGAIAVALFTAQQLWIPIAAPIGTLLLAAINVQFREQHEKQMMMNLFARHVSSETASLIWQNRADIFQHGQLEAHEMIVTVLFSDIRGFTSVSEQLSPRDLLTWINRYLNAMTDCIHAHHGVVDKYIGDAIMAVFGAPFPHTAEHEIQQDALNAVKAAIAMQNRLTALNEQLQQAGQPQITAGIGIHTGRVISGSIGGSERLNYSILGDTVNVAARLEQLNKTLNLQHTYDMLVSGTTFNYVQSHYQGLPLQSLQLRGRQQSTLVYAITRSQSLTVQGQKEGIYTLETPDD